MSEDLIANGQWQYNISYKPEILFCKTIVNFHQTLSMWKISLTTLQLYTVLLSLCKAVVFFSMASLDNIFTRGAISSTFNMLEKDN